MKRKQRLIIAFGSLVVVTMGFTTLTFAWLNYTKNISAVKISSGSLALSNLSTTTYKYVYEKFKDNAGNPTDFTNYFGTGQVEGFTTGAEMNIYDPTYLTITNKKSQAGVNELNTNLVIALSFDLTYSTSIDFTINVAKKTYTPVDNSHLGISSFLRFNSYSQSDYNSLDTSAYSANKDKIFYGIKTADQAAASHFVLGSTHDNLDIYSAPLVATRPSVQTTSSFSFYLAMDYDFSTTTAGGVVDFYDLAHIGNKYTLDDDFLFTIKAVQGSL